MRLMIVESPTKARKIGSILGRDWIVKASLGHILDLPHNDLAVEPHTYRLAYELSPRGKEVVASLRALVEKANEIYLATDSDREGEAIAAHVKAQLNIDSYKRVTFTEITERGIGVALQSPRQIDAWLVSAQEARRALDRLIGYRVSYPISSVAGLSLSVGRCQSPAIRLVVERQLEIDKFAPTDHFSALVAFENGAWTAEWTTQPFLAPGEDYIRDRPLAEQAASCRHFVVAGSSQKSLRKAPPPPFTTSTLLQAAGAMLGYAPALTQSLAQKLFENGHITYHRTDNPNLSDDGAADIRVYANDKGWPVAGEPRAWPLPDGAQAAHEAIRPTHIAQREAGGDAAEQALYNLIWRRAVASQLADADYRVTTLDLASQGGPRKFNFLARSPVLISAGWKIVAADDKTHDDEQEEESNGSVPLLRIGAEVTAIKGQVLSHTTKPPRRYTETSLIRKLEEIGIGRPSTFAAIVKHICADKGYLTVQKRYLAPTPAGYAVVRNLIGRFSFINYDFTRELEKSLDLIAEGKTDYHAVVSAVDGQLDRELERLAQQKPAFPCPACGKALRSIAANGHSFWGCSGYRDGCLVICADDDGKPGKILTHTDKPSDKALAYARDIAVRNGLVIPEDALVSAKKLGVWIDDALKKIPPRPASEKQIKFVGSILDASGEEPPKGWPDDLTAKDAGDFIDRHVKNGKKAAARNPAANGRMGRAAPRRRRSDASHQEANETKQ
jgi:DNA topoisomerase-1